MLSHPFATSAGGWVRLMQLVAGSVIAALLLWASPVAELEEGVGLGVLYALRGPLEAPPHVLIVSADVASSRKLGVPERADRWPRRLHAQLVEGMAAHGALAIGFDLLFQQAREAEDDAMLQAAIREAGNVVLVEGVRREPTLAPDGRLLATVDVRIPPHPMFAEAAYATAPFVLPKTPHGVLAFWSEVPALGDRASLPLQLARLYLQRSATARGEATMDATGQLGGGLKATATRYLNLHGPLGTIHTVGYDEALAALADPAAADALFRGKVVLVGNSEANQSHQVDAYRTPYTGRDGLDVSGVELCATAVANLLQRSWLKRPGEGAALLLVAGVVLLLVLPWVWLAPGLAAALNGGVALAYGGFAHAAFSQQQLWLPLVMPAGVMPLVVLGLGLGLRYRQARRERAGFARAAELGLPARAAARLGEALGGVGGVGGRTVFAVCMCSDIEGYTRLAETLSPLEMRNRLNAYLERFLPVVEQSGGYAADIVGDSVMTVWIAQGSLDVVCARASEAALTLDRILNREGTAPVALRTRFGLHCGPVFFGEVGVDGRRELRVVGDVVNTASRIQGVNKQLGTRILASDAVAEELPAACRRRLGRFALVGKAEPLVLHQILDEASPACARGAGQAVLEAGLAAFERGDLVLAEECFARALEQQSEADVSAFFLALCRQQREAPSEAGCDGVVRLGSK